jgi:PhzF family phenazine biosynthesis protein
MGLEILQVDAFTDRPFSGNPAAVCVLPGPRDDGWMQDVAREMNLSETAFLVRRDDGWGLRWFTPAVEVELCGHATLASAHALWETGLLGADETARFHTLSGELRAVRRGDRIELDFPARPAEPVSAPPGLSRALDAEPIHVGRNDFNLLVVIESEELLRELRPDIGLLRGLPSRGVIVTSEASMEGYDFVSRYFAPRVGVDEDPVTGSAHCCLAPYWSGVLGRAEMKAYQASARGGTVGVRVAGDRVHLSGQAVTVLRAELLAG